jgi:hypothetical protein
MGKLSFLSGSRFKQHFFIFKQVKRTNTVLFQDKQINTANAIASGTRILVEPYYITMMITKVMSCNFQGDI